MRTEGEVDQQVPTRGDQGLEINESLQIPRLEERNLGEYLAAHGVGLRRGAESRRVVAEFGKPGHETGVMRWLELYVSDYAFDGYSAGDSEEWTVDL